jgi:hypothetical protein
VREGSASQSKSCEHLCEVHFDVALANVVEELGDGFVVAISWPSYIGSLSGYTGKLLSRIDEVHLSPAPWVNDTVDLS